jgi:uncharacterized protein (TIGR01777 family)
MLRVLVTGGTGFIGGALVRALLSRGNLVTVLTRDAAKGRSKVPRDARVVAWSPGKPGPWEDELSVVDAVVHLAGATVVKRWTDSYKKQIRSSRVDTARALVDAIGKHEHRPEVLVSASGVGYYGADHPGEELDEGSGPGSDFLAKVCIDWESEARRVEDHGVRSVQLRIGSVLGEGGGMVDGMVQLGGAFVGGPIGKGDNIVSWVHLDDVVGMILMAIDDDSISGPINATSPYVATQRELAETMGSVLGRPALGVPLPVAKAILGDLVSAACGSLNAQPKRAMELGYEYHYAHLTPALEDALMAEHP